MNAGDAFAPIERQSLAEQVAGRLLELVRTRNLKPGDMLPPERELATLLQVSRPSVREAVRGLQILGVLKARQGSGIYVSSLGVAELLGPLQLLITLDPDNADALFRARVLIDGEVARLACLGLPEAELARLQQMLELQRGLTGDPVRFRLSDMEFHRTIGVACGNPVLERVSHALYALGMEYRRIASETAGVLTQSLQDHEAIVAAFAAGDAAAAAEAMRLHMRNVHLSTVHAMEHP